MHISKQYTLIKWLSRLIEQGYSLQESIQRLSLIEKQAMKKLKEKLDQGLPLDDALRTLHFKPYAYNFVTIGLKSNRLDRCLQLLIKRYEFDLTLNRLWQQLLFYPTVLFSMALVGFEYLRIQLYPLLMRMAEIETVSTPPSLTFLSFHLLKVIFVGLIILYVVFRRFPRLFNVFSLIKGFRTLTFCHHLNLLLSSGYSLEESLQQLKAILDPKDVFEFEKILMDPYYESNSFCSFTDGFLHSFQFGLSTNQLSEQLADYESFSFELVQTKVKQLIHWIQYGLFLVIALNILMVYYVMMMPMIRMTDWL